MADMKMVSTDRIKALLTLTPSILLIAVFVYGFIANTFWLSLTDWGGVAALSENPVRNFIGPANYVDLFTGFLGGGFRQDLVNAVFYSLLLISGAVAVGILLAILLDRKPKGLSVFRTLFLYPMALSFIVSGTIWRWMLSPQGRVNLLPTLFGLERFQFRWLSSRQAVLQFNWQDLFLVVGGMILAVLALRARSLGPPILCHALYNGLLVGLPVENLPSSILADSGPLFFHFTVLLAAVCLTVGGALLLLHGGSEEPEAVSG